MWAGSAGWRPAPRRLGWGLGATCCAVVPGLSPPGSLRAEKPAPARRRLLGGSRTHRLALGGHTPRPLQALGVLSLAGESGTPDLALTSSARELWGQNKAEELSPPRRQTQHFLSASEWLAGSVLHPS